MKTCPKCGKTYSDPSLNFCLEDGSILNQTDTGKIPPPTVMMNDPRRTGSEQPFGGPSGAQNQFVPVQNTNVKKGSKAWIWVVGILGVVVLLCGGGMGGLMLIGSLSNKNNSNTKLNTNFATNKYNTNSIAINALKSNTDGDSQSDVKTIDLSKWVQTDSKFGKTEFRGDELIANALKNDFYYVLVASITNQSSDATTKITVRDLESGNNRLGYGLIINSNPVPLIKGYAFLINAKTSKYRIVTHAPGKENVVVNWKDSATIKSGTAENILEVKDENNQLKFFINGDLVDSVSNKDGYSGGVPGIYVGGTSPVAFSNMEIRK